MSFLYRKLSSTSDWGLNYYRLLYTTIQSLEWCPSLRTKFALEQPVPSDWCLTLNQHKHPVPLTGVLALALKYPVPLTGAYFLIPIVPNKHPVPLTGALALALKHPVPSDWCLIINTNSLNTNIQYL